MKKCPLCAEEIQDEAKKCKHCQSNLYAVVEDNNTKTSNIKFKTLFFLLFIGGGLAYYFLMPLSDPDLLDSVKKYYGYQSDYELKIISLKKNSAIKVGVVQVKHLVNNQSWNRVFNNYGSGWRRSAEQLSEDSQELDEIMLNLQRMAGGMRFGDEVYFRKEDRDKYREVVRIYKIKNPKSDISML